jgi:Flp pilus assembly protein protease CpaA
MNIAYLPILHFSLFSLTWMGGWQDWHTREVSNWISVPIFLAGFLASVLRAFQLDFTAMLVTALLLYYWNRNWLGGADVKMLSGLLGLWPTAAIWGLAGMGIVGLVFVLRLEGWRRFPAITVLAVTTGLTFLLENATIRSN